MIRMDFSERPKEASETGTNSSFGKQRCFFVLPHNRKPAVPTPRTNEVNLA